MDRLPPKPTTKAAPPLGILALARSWQSLLGSPDFPYRADLARHLDVSRAWVTQVLSILHVSAPVLSLLEAAEADHLPITEREWRRLKRLTEADQLRVLMRRRRQDRGKESESATSAADREEDDKDDEDAA